VSGSRKPSSKAWGNQVSNRVTKRNHVGNCPRCGKRRYITRKDAKTAYKLFFPGRTMNTYQCGEYWHYGNKGPNHGRHG